MDVLLSSDAADVSRRADPLLTEHRVAANMLATVLVRQAAGPVDRAGRAPARWAVVEDSGAVVGVGVVGLGSGDAGLWVTPMPDAAAAALVGALDAETAAAVSRVEGPEPAAGAVTAALAARTHRACRVETREGVLLLGALVRPRGVPGAARVAGADDVDTVLALVAAFAAEVGHGDGPPPRAALERRVREGAWLVHDVDGTVVSLAHLHPAAWGVARIGPVFTPPAHRRSGYAAALTAAACCRQLAAGADDVMLYTDLANPTSNRVYERIGFRRVADAASYLLTATG